MKARGILKTKQRLIHFDFLSSGCFKLYDGIVLGEIQTLFHIRSIRSHICLIQSHTLSNIRPMIFIACNYAQLKRILKGKVTPFFTEQSY